MSRPTFDGKDDGIFLNVDPVEGWKSFSLDCGLLLRACGLAAADVEREPDLMLVNADLVEHAHRLLDEAP